MASIKRYVAAGGSETWRVRYRLKGHSSSKTFANERSARAFGEMVDRWGPEQALEFIKEPTTTRTKSGTVADCVERYAALRSPKTAKHYRDNARLHINPPLGRLPISKLTPETVQLWVNTLNVSASTIRLLHSILSGSLTLAVARREIPENPAAKKSKTNPGGIRLPRTRPVVEPVFLTHDEYRLVIKANQEFYRPLVEFLAGTGCRIGEALALSPSDVNLKNGKVKFNKTFSVDETGHYAIRPSKTESSEREIAVPRRILEQLDLSKERVFTGRRGGPLRAHHFRTSWTQAVRNSGLPEHRQPRIHDLRHTHASWLLDAGVSLHAIKNRLGHSDIMTTLQIYGHAAEDSEDRILNVLN